MASNTRRRYAEIMRDVEALINDHIKHQKNGTERRSKLKLLVPPVGVFHTPLLLEEAFMFQDMRRRISSRRFVAPSFNDIRIILNSAQLMSLARQGPLELITFDGDVTLYDDGKKLNADDPVVSRIIALLAQNVKVAVITAAGYTTADRYYERLSGLLDEVVKAVKTGHVAKPDLLVMGGEANFLFAFDTSEAYLLKKIPREKWLLPQMKEWSEGNIKALLDIAEEALKDCVETLGLSADIVRKERAVGIVPSSRPGALKFTREQLEETVLVTQQVLEISAPKIPFCAFNGSLPFPWKKLNTFRSSPLTKLGGNDVFVDVGDKSWGVLVCQQYLGGVSGSRTLHVGDQFLSAGSNDFKARLACTTAWIANPAETVQLLDELAHHRQ